ncbi:hypothetical protein HGRIS_004871 [Hohenbuehelia grisea]|uniref:F-box domain-containing protein n=1 Tax=Hohenbuehelia grisea TaxID=104357 RepID=A0ABR3JD90_9AGAR
MALVFGHPTGDDRSPIVIPILPLEIQRDIFELTAKTHKGTAATLARVSRGAQTWMETIIYEVICLSNRRQCSRFMFTIDNRPAHFFVAHVKALLLPYQIHDDQTARILAKCSAVVNLACWAPTYPMAVAEVQDALSLRQLTIRMSTLCRIGDTGHTHPTFTHLTHLWLIDDCISWMSYTGFHHLRALTHLALDFSAVSPTILARAVAALSLILGQCTTLQVCLLLTHKHEMEEKLRVLEAEGLGDSRLVVLAQRISVDNWENTARAEHHRLSSWAIASEVVRRRGGMENEGYPG